MKNRIGAYQIWESLHFSCFFSFFRKKSQQYYRSEENKFEFYEKYRLNFVEKIKLIRGRLERYFECEKPVAKIFQVLLMWEQQRANNKLLWKFLVGFVLFFFCWNVSETGERSCDYDNNDSYHISNNQSKMCFKYIRWQ